MKSLNKLGIAFAFSQCILPVYAGSMGASVEPQPVLIPFSSLEGSYTWNEMNGVSINGFSANVSKDGWGGRAAVGVRHPLSSNVGISSEMGWGYFGSETRQITRLDATAKYKIYGIDLLVGAYYRYNNFDIFAKAGVMLQSIRVNALINQSQTVAGGDVSGVVENSVTLSGTPPELKAGGMYHVNENLGVTLAYMFVSGYKIVSTTNQSVTPGRITSNGTNSLGPVTLNAIMLGLNYNFL